MAWWYQRTAQTTDRSILGRRWFDQFSCRAVGGDLFCFPWYPKHDDNHREHITCYGMFLWLSHWSDLFRGEVPLLGCQSLRRSWASWIGRTLPGQPSLKEIKIAKSNLNCRPNLNTRVNLLKKREASPGESHSYTSLLRLVLFLTLPQLMIG